MGGSLGTAAYCPEQLEALNGRVKHPLAALRVLGESFLWVTRLYIILRILALCFSRCIPPCASFRSGLGWLMSKFDVRSDNVFGKTPDRKEQTPAGGYLNLNLVAVLFFGTWFIIMAYASPSAYTTTTVTQTMIMDDDMNYGVAFNVSVPCNAKYNCKTLFLNSTFEAQSSTSMLNVGIRPNQCVYNKQNESCWATWATQATPFLIKEGGYVVGGFNSGAKYNMVNFTVTSKVLKQGPFASSGSNTKKEHYVMLNHSSLASEEFITFLDSCLYLSAPPDTISQIPVSVRRFCQSDVTGPNPACGNLADVSLPAEDGLSALSFNPFEVHTHDFSFPQSGLVQFNFINTEDVLYTVTTRTNPLHPTASLFGLWAAVFILHPYLRSWLANTTQVFTKRVQRGVGVTRWSGFVHALRAALLCTLLSGIRSWFYLTIMWLYDYAGYFPNKLVPWNHRVIFFEAIVANIIVLIDVVLLLGSTCFGPFYLGGGILAMDDGDDEQAELYNL